MLYEMFSTDKAAEAENGIDLDFGRGVVVTIRRAGGANERYERVARRVFKPYQAQIDADTLPREMGVKLLARIYAEAVVIGWRGVTGPDGKPIEFTVDNCIRIFTDLPEFFSAVKRQAESAASFRRQAIEADKEALGNG